MPPPPPEQPAARLVARLEPWKNLIAVAGILLAAGAAFAAWERKVAKAQDVDQVRAGVASQIGAVQTETQALGTRVTVLEAAVKELREDMRDDIRFFRAQLIEIAKATGARQLAPPPTTQGATP